MRGKMMAHYILTKEAKTKKGMTKNIQHAEDMGNSKKEAKAIAKVAAKSPKERYKTTRRK